MPDETATLKDTVVSETPAAEVTETPKADTPDVPELAKASPEAAEIGRLILESGFSKEQLNDLLNAPQMLQQMRYTLENNPKEFLSSLERMNPEMGGKFLETMADTYLERYGERKRPTPGKSDKDDSQNGDLMREVEALREQTTRLLTDQQRRDQAASLAAVRQRYDARVDDLIGLKEVKEMGLTSSEVKNLKARLSQELSSDPGAVERVNRGNFVDVPKVFQSLLQEKAEDKRSAIEAEKKGRERQQGNGLWEFQQGPSPIGDIPTGTFDSWDATEDGFAKALERTAR